MSESKECRSLFPMSAEDKHRQQVRAEMKRLGIAPGMLDLVDDDEFGILDPWADFDQVADNVKRFLAAVWDDPTDPLRHLAPTAVDNNQEAE